MVKAIDPDAPIDYGYLEAAVNQPDDPGPVPKQLRILRKLAAHLEVTSGCKCFLGVDVLSADMAEDALSILEAPRPIIGQPAGEGGLKRLEGWTILIQGWPRDNKKSPSSPAYFMKAKVEQQLALIVAELPDGKQRTDALYRLGGDISGLTIGQGVVRPAGEAAPSRLAMFYLPVVISLHTSSINPYA